MRQSLLTLLILNCVYFTWSFILFPEKPPVKHTRTEIDIPMLTLLPELAGTSYNSSTADTISSCYSLGPYNSQRASQLVADKISSYGLAVTPRTLRSMETLSFFVYINPLPSYAEAENITKDLEKYDVKEYSIVEEGPYKNAIAFGFFENLNKAKRHAEYIRYLGYDAKFTQQQSAREVYWLDYDEPFGSNTPVLEWSRVIDQSSIVQRIPRQCEQTEE